MTALAAKDATWIGRPDCWRVQTTSSPSSGDFATDIFYVHPKMKEDLTACLRTPIKNAPDERVMTKVLIGGLSAEHARTQATIQHLNKTWPAITENLKRLFALWLVVKGGAFFDHPEKLPANISVAFLDKDYYTI